MTERARRKRALPILLLLAAAGGGCTALTVANMILDAETTVSVTVHGDEEQLVVMVANLEQLSEVRTIVRAVEVGVRVLEIAGTYAQVIESLRWITEWGLALVANDEVTVAILEAAAIAFLR